jgi:y4mF family transcriptional regulator
MTPVELGAHIRRTRIAQHLRQEQLAAAAGVGIRFLVELEAGKPTAQLGKTLKVLDTLGCRVEITASTQPGDRA